MKLPDKATIQRLGRPGVQAALMSDHAQTVQLRRPGQPDVQVRALLLPWSDEGRGGTAVAGSEVRAVAWFGLLAHTAPVAELGFSLVTAAGRIFTPDSPPENFGNADVAWGLRLTPLAERTRVSLLTFTLPGQGWSQDSRGNRIPAPGTPHPVSARLTATTDPRIRDEVGADAADVVLIGRWGTLEHPLPRPAGVTWGSTSPLDLDGQPGTLTVTLAYPDPDLAQEAQFGSRFLATWRSS